MESLAQLDASHKRLTFPHHYVTAIEAGLYDKQQKLLLKMM